MLVAIYKTFHEKAEAAKIKVKVFNANVLNVEIFVQLNIFMIL